jgi:ketosteroid isomerase-like protein
VEVAKGGDIAYSQGTYVITMPDPKTKKETVEHGTYVTVYKKQADGTWKAVEDINTPGAPEPPPPAPKKK